MDQFNWDDITPLSIEEKTTPELCHILYSDNYKHTMGLLRRLMSLKEYSERALFLTQEAINMVAAHYTVWQYRFHNVRALKKDILEELEWCDEVLVSNQKNYQIWHYRQLLIQEYETMCLKDPELKPFEAAWEMPLIETMLIEDNKNYHVWSYKKWLLDHFKLYDEQGKKEFEFVEKMLVLDVRNNSAWNYRYFLVANTEHFDLEKELTFVHCVIDLAPQNESLWNYLLGICKLYDKPVEKLEELCKKYAELPDSLDVEPIVQSSHLLEILLKIYAGRDEKQKLMRVYEMLIERYDPIRVNYWNYLKLKCVV